MGGSTSAATTITQPLPNIQPATLEVGADGVPIEIPVYGVYGKDRDPLYTKIGKACCWADARDFEYRMRQMQMMNYAIAILSRDLYQNVATLNAKNTINEAMEYKDSAGNPVPGYDWRNLSEAEGFSTDYDKEANVFRRLETFVDTHQGLSNDELKKELTEILKEIIKARAVRAEKMATECQE